MAGYRCFSGVRYWTRGCKEKVVWSTISLIGLDPDGCLVADLLKVHAINLKSWGQINKKGLHPRWLVTLQKTMRFCDG